MLFLQGVSPYSEECRTGAELQPLVELKAEAAQESLCAAQSIHYTAFILFLLI